MVVPLTGVGSFEVGEGEGFSEFGERGGVERRDGEVGVLVVMLEEGFEGLGGLGRGLVYLCKFP